MNKFSLRCLYILSKINKFLPLDYGALEVIALGVQNFCGHFIPLRFLCPEAAAAYYRKYLQLMHMHFSSVAFVKISRRHFFSHKNAFYISPSRNKMKTNNSLFDLKCSSFTRELHVIF